jgi:hypothetical protein
MSQVFIENPKMSSPFNEPTRRVQFTEEGITNEIVDGHPNREERAADRQAQTWGRFVSAGGPSA